MSHDGRSRSPREKKNWDHRSVTNAAAPAHRKETARPQVAIADKNPVVRAGLADFLARDGRFAVGEVVANGAAFLGLCESGRVDIGVIGWALPDMTGADVLEVVKRRNLGTRVIVYTGEDTPSVLRQAVKSGAWGFISKSDDPGMLLDTIATVARGRLCLPYVDIEALNKDPLEMLTVRERELLAALANGWTNLQIAARFGISGNTVKYHLKNLYDKLAVKNRAMAVALYMSAPKDVR